MGIGPSIDELRRHTYIIARLQDRPLNDGIDTEFLGDFRYHLICIFVLHGRSSGDDSEGLDFTEFSAQGIGHAIDEVFLLRVAGKILEWQHYNRLDGACYGQRNGFSFRLSGRPAQFEPYYESKEYQEDHGCASDEPGQYTPRPGLGFSSACFYGFRWQRWALQIDRCVFECHGSITDIAQTAARLLVQTVA